MSEETHYAVLGVSETADFDAIKKAYRARCLDYHPDGLPDHRAKILRFATNRMKRVNDAWRVLQDAERRRAYDASLRTTRQGPAPRGTPDASRFQEEISRLARELEKQRGDFRDLGAKYSATKAENERLLEELRRLHEVANRSMHEEPESTGSWRTAEDLMRQTAEQFRSTQAAREFQARAAAGYQEADQSDPDAARKWFERFGRAQRATEREEAESEASAFREALGEFWWSLKWHARRHESWWVWPVWALVFLSGLAFRGRSQVAELAFICVAGGFVTWWFRRVSWAAALFWVLALILAFWLGYVGV